MKIKRQKQVKKNLNFHKYNFNFREPFQILIDGTFCQAALENKIQIKEQMPKYFMGEVQLCTTNCALEELGSLKALFGAKVILQKFQVRNCKHLKKPVPAAECLMSMLEETNPHHYFVATQDREVTAGLRKIPGVPLLYIILNTIVLDKPSQASLSHVQAVQLGQLVTPAQQQTIHSLKQEQQGVGQDGEKRGKKRKRKVSNPNPLSCLKKKKKQLPTQPLSQAKTEGEKKKQLPTQLLSQAKTEGEKKKRSRRWKGKPAEGKALSVNP